ncbi:uncharacterized protein LOC109536602 [Dendroctonus ponderosae]
MSESLSNAAGKNSQPLNSKESKSDTPTEKRNLTFSHSENTLENQRQKTGKQKPLAKVKSWSSKEHHSKDQCVSVELDLARSLTKLEVVVSSENLGSNLLRARDSLDNLLKDEQNMPTSSLARSIVLPKPKNMPESPKSSPQLGEKFKASTSSKGPFWDPYDRQGKKNRKDLKRRSKGKSTDQRRNQESSKESPPSKHGGNVASGAETSGTNQESSSIEEESFEKYKYMTKNSKSVVFTNEVLVVYFNNEDVVGEEKEPLKKEVEQQTRNKEMRRVHLNRTQEKYNLCLF